MDEHHEYRAVVNLDYTRTRNNDYQRILKALDGAGWSYVETSAMAYEGDLDGVRRGLEVLARSIQTGGILSALTVQVQLIGPTARTPGAARPENALRAVLRMPLPSDAN
jgi:hypothetical protein